MKTKYQFAIFIFFLTLIHPLILVAQHLDVEGDSKIRGRLDLAHDFDPSSVYIGIDAGINTTNIVGPDTFFTYNTLIGSDAGSLNTTGFMNTAVGSQSLSLNTTGDRNTATGKGALYFNKTGQQNTAVGEETLHSNTTGNDNTAIGRNALFSASTASFNTAVGASALYYDTTGGENTAIGYFAGLLNKDGRWNTMIGSQAGRDFTGGDNNVFIGQASGLSHGTGDNNVFVGRSAGRMNNNSNNVFIGDNAGRMNKGSGNVYIGHEAGMLDSVETSNTLIIANSSAFPPLIYGDFANNKLGINCSSPGEAFSVVGNIAATGTILASQMACSSDRRYKKDIREFEQTLSKILKLKPVRYRWRAEEFPEKHFIKEEQIGFIAQEVEQIYPELIHTNAEGYKSLDYARLTVILTRAIQEQQKNYLQDIKNLEDQNSKLMELYLGLSEKIKNLEAHTSNY
ncbi:MAG: tail fiber domain-containing protein [Saprospiraceae bacterium]|nr:tail fiber domain-containing protein [Saprospiraceae bacterium]